jgi:MFS family permease
LFIVRNRREDLPEIGAQTVDISAAFAYLCRIGISIAFFLELSKREFSPMTTVAYAPSEQKSSSLHDKVLFWGCFIALVTTAFGFIARIFLIDEWAIEFNLDPAQAGRLTGIGIWPFAVSIIGFSLIIDKIGYKVSMLIAFMGHIIWAAMGVSAYFISHNGDKETGFQLLYWGSLILALGNGTVESFINPVVATMFHKDKTKWLNILHAGWPGGLVIAGILTIYINDVEWYIKVGIIAIPAVLYLLILLPLKFPVQERVASGVSYRDMLSEFGILGALVVGFLVTLQMMDFYSNDGTRTLTQMEKNIFIGIGAAIVLGFGIYTRSLGRFLMFYLILIMMPLATTEIGTDGWITSIMKDIASQNKFNPGWILVYTSAIMMVLRFFAGPIVHILSPLGLLALSALLAILGLYTLSFSTGMVIFGAATLYGIGKTFFWPTMLGVVSEQMPKGGALTLNAISGIGMLAVGTLGTTYIGTLQANKEITAVASSEVAKEVPGLIKEGKVTVVQDKTIYEILSYQAISGDKLTELVTVIAEPKKTEVKTKLDEVRGASKQGALRDMAFFPGFMLVAYLLLILYFKAKGGYRPVEIGAGGGH